MHLNDIDLNLLRLFDAVYRQRSVSRAAESLALTQPAASHGLTRLRLLIKDPLFIRAPGGVQPTP
jgi:DNA-binding transcriptional LysR family regulator